MTAADTPRETVTIHNRLPVAHRWHAAVDPVLRAALREVSGAWAVSVHPIDRLWFQIDVVAPDGARWSTSASTQDGPRIEDLAETIRAACIRHCRGRRADDKRRRGASEAASRAPTPKGNPR